MPILTCCRIGLLLAALCSLAGPAAAADSDNTPDARRPWVPFTPRFGQADNIYYDPEITSLKGGMIVVWVLINHPELSSPVSYVNKTELDCGRYRLRTMILRRYAQLYARGKRLGNRIYPANGRFFGPIPGTYGTALVAQLCPQPQH